MFRISLSSGWHHPFRNFSLAVWTASIRVFPVPLLKAEVIQICHLVNNEVTIDPYWEQIKAPFTPVRTKFCIDEFCSWDPFLEGPERILHTVIPKVVAYWSGRPRELFITKFESQLKWGFPKVVATGAELVAYKSGRKESFDCSRISSVSCGKLGSIKGEFQNSRLII